MIQGIIGGLAVAVVLVGGWLVAQPALPVPNLGALVGPEVFDHMQLRQSATIGGNVYASSSQGTVTYTTAGINNNVSLIQQTATAALTANLPASTSLTSFVPFPGDTKRIYLKNMSTAAITLRDGQGVLLKVASSTNDTRILATSTAELNFIRKSNTDIEVLMISTTPTP